MALCLLVWNATFSFSQRRCERMGRQVLALGHAQVGDGDEVGCGSVAPCGPLGRLKYRQLLAQRQCECLKQRRKARALACPRHTGLTGFAAASASHTRHIGVKPSLKLEEVQMTPRAAQPIMNRLFGCAAVRARQPFGRATHLKVDTPQRGVQVNLFDLPRRHQAQRAGEQTLDANTRTTLDFINSMPPSRKPHGPTTGANCECCIPH